MRKFWILLLCIACGSAKEDPNLIQAGTVHDEAIKIGHDSSMGVSQLKSLEAKMKPAQLDTLNAIMADLSEWYESLVEVPGHEHDHHGHDHGGHDHSGHDHSDHEHDHGEEHDHHDDHEHSGEEHDHSGHDHDHDHGNETNYLEGLHSDQVLAIQVELKKEIEWIQARVIQLLQEVKENE